MSAVPSLYPLGKYAWTDFDTPHSVMRSSRFRTGLWQGCDAVRSPSPQSVVPSCAVPKNGSQEVDCAPLCRPDARSALTEVRAWKASMQ